MPSKELGTKYTCFKCGTRFYDLKKPEPICPKCGADQRQAQPARSAPAAERRSRAPAKVVEPAVEEVEAETADLDEDLEADEDVDEVEEDEP